MGGIFYFVRKQSSFASINDIAIPIAENNYAINIDLLSDGRVKVNDQYFNNILNPKNDYAEFRYIATEAQGTFIDQIDITVNLPADIDASAIDQKVYAVHGVGSSDYSIKDSRTLLYTATNLTPSSTFTAYASLPKGIFKFPWYKNIVYYFYNLSGTAWLVISMLLPVITIIILLFMFRQVIDDWKIKKTDSVLQTPPNDLSPAEAGILLDGTVSSRSIAAILLDLAQREYLQVSSHDGEFNFIKKKTVDTTANSISYLKPFEQQLLAKIFNPNEEKSSLGNIQVRIGRHVFSRKIAEVYLDLYNGITKRGYFMENPSTMHRKYRTVGLVSFFAALAGFLVGIFVIPDPKFLLIFWAAMLFTSFIIIKRSPQLPARTAFGKKELLKWLAFKNFLCEESPIGYIEGSQKIFERYLPYAVAMRCEVEWARRFVEHPFQIPEWYLSKKPVVILEDFINDLFPVIGYVSRELAASKEPIV